VSKVYFKKVNQETSTTKIKAITKELLEKIITEKQIKLEKTVPLKVHFGEKGNITFIKPENFDGIVDFLEEKNIKSYFMETSSLYGGQRYKKDLHLKTAKEHGFTRLPVVIADGDCGENFIEIEINKKHFKSCKLGAEFDKYSQLIVIAHFKGHMLAGFGGAIKQLSMGYASKGGKLAMHAGGKPHIVSRKCKKCKLCLQRCNVDAINIGEKSFIDKEKCVGCGACAAICPHGAISLFSAGNIFKAVSTMGNPFREKIVEYAYAAQKGKSNIYINFAMNITKGCDCEPKKMEPLMDDIGILISTNPVAIDQACYDLVAENGKRFKGESQLGYAEKVGIGSREYDLVEI